MGEFYSSGQCVQFVRCVGVYTNFPLFTQQPPLPTTHIQAGQKIHCLLNSVSNNYEGEEILVDRPQ